MKITLEAYKHKYTVETEYDDVTLEQLIQEIFLPLATLAGYQTDKKEFLEDFKHGLKHI